jgi:hypothetical protein
MRCQPALRSSVFALLLATILNAAPVPAPCQVPRNCGTHNNSLVCGHKFTGCEFTCEFCCGTPAGHAACDACTVYSCKPVPPLPLPIPTCNATNYHEFWCTVANKTESFSALATRLHVSPTKLCEYNFQYDCDAGVMATNSIRVPFDQCTPKIGGWNCHEVKDGDTLVSVASSPQSLTFDARALRNTNLDILYGESTLHAGMHLRLPLHICYEDELNDCHIVAVGDTLASVAATYKTTAQQLCSLNVKILVDTYCDPGIRPLQEPSVGMELLVPTLRPSPPSPCKEIPGYWSCYTVKAGETLGSSNIDAIGIAMRVGASRDELIEINFGKNPNRCVGKNPNRPNCSDATKCPPHLGPYPECLKIGQVLTVPVATPCTPRPGVWDCGHTTMKVKSPYDDDTLPSWYSHCLHSDWYPVAGWSAQPLIDLFCKANRRAFPGCRDGSMSPAGGSAIWDMCTANQTVKIPAPICIPNDKSYCSGTNSTVDPERDIYQPVGWRNVTCAQGGEVTLALSLWDGNELVMDHSSCFGPEYHIPRGSLSTGGRGSSVACTPAPGEHICHKPLPPIPKPPARSGDGCQGVPCVWEDSVYQIAKQFGVDWQVLCAFNQMKNCSNMNYEGASLKIPVRPGPAPTPLLPTPKTLTPPPEPTASM